MHPATLKDNILNVYNNVHFRAYFIYHVSLNEPIFVKVYSSNVLVKHCIFFESIILWMLWMMFSTSLIASLGYASHLLVHSEWRSFISIWNLQIFSWWFICIGIRLCCSQANVYCISKALSKFSLVSTY